MIDKTEIIKLPLYRLQTNQGQIEGLPKNPRLIKDERFYALVKSIQDDPDFLWARPLVVFPFGEGFVIIAGNMRFHVCQHLMWESVQCFTLPEDFPYEKLRALVIKDNLNFGQNDWDALANDWDEFELIEFGMEEFAPVDFDETKTLALKLDPSEYQELMIKLAKIAASPEEAVTLAVDHYLRKEMP